MDYKILVPEKNISEILRVLKELGLAVPFEIPDKTEITISIKVPWVKAGPYTRADLKAYAEDANARERSAIRLFKGGVLPDDIPEVLDLRNFMTYRQGMTEAVTAAPSIDVMIKAYHECGEDIELLTIITDRALEIVSNRDYEKVRPKHLNRAITTALEEYMHEDRPDFDRFGDESDAE